MPLLGFYSCDEDVDGITQGEFSYIIVNNTPCEVEINSIPMSKEENENNEELYSILPFDSICLNGISSWHQKTKIPFKEGDLIIAFDDTIKCKCMQDGRCMLNNPYFYEEVLVEPEKKYVYRYVITEEDYEYAKAHPCMGEK